MLFSRLRFEYVGKQHDQFVRRPVEHPNEFELFMCVMNDQLPGCVIGYGDISGPAPVMLQLGTLLNGSSEDAHYWVYGDLWPCGSAAFLTAHIRALRLIEPQ